MSTAQAPDVDRLRAAVEAVCDPELPPLTLVDLGILRSVGAEPDGTVVVTVTPTYSGCPAVEYIEDEIARTLEANDCDRFRVERSFTPAWTTDWITEDGRRKLIEIGIAPPGPSTGPVPVPLGRRPAIPCPRCGSADTEEISRFGSTACKALYRCRSCTEPFDSFKAI
ncbi:MAG: 1,2-phenylacetyl-CoA epoxidase subunit PaaD [Actinomycetota bacterium]